MAETAMTSTAFPGSSGTFEACSVSSEQFWWGGGVQDRDPEPHGSSVLIRLALWHSSGCVFGCRVSKLVL